MKILFFPYTEELGSTHVLVKIAEVLRDRGHEINFVGSGKYVPFIKRNGFKVEKIIEVDIETHKAYTRKASLSFYTKESIREFVRQEIEIITELKPDVIVDLLRPTLSISSEITKVPRVTICNAILTNYYDLPIEIPETHWAHRIFQISAFKPYMYTLAKYVAYLSYIYWSKPYNKVMKEYGLKKIKNILSLFEGDYTIVMDAEEFAPIQRVKNVFAVGPILHDIDVSKPEWVDKIDSNKTVIYVSMGSTGDMLPNVVKDLAYFYGNNNNYQIVVSTLGLYSFEREEIPQNFFMTEYINASLILRKARMVISHGGRGTIYHSLLAGIPLIGIPHQPEQEWNMNRIEYLGLGIKISKRFYKAEDLNYNIEKLANDQSYKINAFKFKEKLKKYNGPFDAADIIERSVNANRKKISEN